MSLTTVSVSSPFGYCLDNRLTSSMALVFTGLLFHDSGWASNQGGGKWTKKINRRDAETQSSGWTEEEADAGL